MRWNLDLRAWLFAEMRSSNKPYWLIIDGIDQVRPRRDTHDLIMKLVQGAEKKEHLRVVLLAYSQPLPISIQARTEEIGPITDDLIAGFFSDFFEHQHKGASSTDIEKAVEDVKRRVLPSSLAHLRELSKAVEKVAKGEPMNEDEDQGSHSAEESVAND